ncbi:MAG: alpha/beta hydrolase [Novosphingobium sp.]|nr:alpha/beta hydrolase [Novosphingobium sp.]
MKPENRKAIQDFDRRAIPKDAVESQRTVGDGHSVRQIDWSPQGRVLRGSLLFMPGRGDFYEKYLETLDYWRSLGWHVTAADWRGQSGSGRLGTNDSIGHIDDFGIWVDDLAELWNDWKAATTGPHVLVGHSMGGHLVLRALAERRVDPVAAVVTAPMLGLQPGTTFIPTSWLHWLVRLVVSRGDPRRSAWRGSERPGWSQSSRIERLTHDQPRFEDEVWWRAERPELDLASPSWGWIEAAFRSILLMRSPGFLETVDLPVLIAATTADRLVEFSAIERAASRIATAQFEVFGEEARHELLREEDKVRDRILSLIDQFLDTSAPVES